MEQQKHQSEISIRSQAVPSLRRSAASFFFLQSFPNEIVNFRFFQQFVKKLKSKIDFFFFYPFFLKKRKHEETKLYYWKMETFHKWIGSSISKWESKVVPVNWRKIFLKHCTTRAKIYPPYFIVQQTICQGSFGVLSKSIIFQMASMGSSVMTPSHHWQRQLTLETGPRGARNAKFYTRWFFFWRILIRPQNCVDISFAVR